MNTSRPLNSMMTHSSLPSRDMNNTTLLPDSQPQCGPTTSSPMSVHQRLLHQYLAQSVPPLTRWLRPSRQTTG
jgi:hypothetical protein